MSILPAAAISGIADVLGHTETGFTNKQIGEVLSASQIVDPMIEAERQAPAGTWVPLSKRDRLVSALNEDQRRRGNSSGVVQFIEEAMTPARYLNDTGSFADRLAKLNEVLVTAGLRVIDTGKLCRTEPADTLDEIHRRAGQLTSELRRRNCHSQVLRYCQVELLRKSNFHAAQEAVKGVFDRLRAESGLSLDGGDLVDAALSFKSKVPVLTLSRLETVPEQSEQRGLMNLLKGFYGMYRNPTAHGTRVERDDTRPIADPELLGLLTALSLVHEHIDRLQRTAAWSG